MSLDFSILENYYGTLAIGVLWTIAITVASAVLSFFGGILLAVVALYAPWLVKQPFRFVSWLFMGTPLLLQLFLIYFGLVQIGNDLPAFVAGVIGLGLHYAVYNSELIQTAILAVDKGQMEAARTLGLSRGQALVRVVVPQAVRDADRLSRLAWQIGLVSLSGVAIDLGFCAERSDMSALEAVRARLMRVGNRSLTQIWDCCDLNAPPR